MLDTCDASVTSNHFESNKAGIGGAIRYIGSFPTFIRDQLHNSRVLEDSSIF